MYLEELRIISNSSIELDCAKAAATACRSRCILISVVIAFTLTVVEVAREAEVRTVVVVLTGVEYTTGCGLVVTTVVVVAGLCVAVATVSSVVRQLVQVTPMSNKQIKRIAFMILCF